MDGMPESAVVAAWELGLRLKERRDHLALSVAAVAKAVKMQQPNLSSVETGRKKITQVNLVKIGKMYGFDGDELEELQALRVAAESRDWYHKYAWLFPEEFIRFLGLESGANSVFAYQDSLVHGLLQTEEYARAVIRGGSPYIRLTEVEPRIEVRLTRRHRLIVNDELRLTVVFSEGVLRQEVGGREVMHRQLQHLATMMARPNIEVRILPFSVGAHPAFGGPFAAQEFDSQWLPTVVWQETVTSGLFIDRPQVVREYSVALAETQNLALSEYDSLDFVRRVAKEMA
jgi:transcriptional regulator with XRE-family HTH domain